MRYKLSDNSILNISICDVQGQEMFRALYETYYKKSDCIILVYDISDRESFELCKTYFCETIKEKCKNDIKVILVGNKIDLENKREVSYEEGDNFAFLNNWLFIEASCLKNINVYETFKKVIEMSLDKTKKYHRNKSHLTKTTNF